VTPKQNLWTVWHSDRNGTDDIYAARYFGKCSVWNSSATGGVDLRVTRFGEEGLQRRARFARVTSDANGNAHIVFQLTDANGNTQVYYTKSKGREEFLTPIKITDSPGNAMMPDVEVVYDSARRPLVVIVWHDDRFVNWEIMSATGVSGAWRSSGFGGQDYRITASKGDSMFPRIAGDKDGNIRLVFHSNRSNDKYDVYMASYSMLAQKWSSSSTGGTDLKVSHGPGNSLFPDIDVDSTGGVAITWQDDRHQAENPDMHEEVYATYCAKMGHPGKRHFAPLITNIEEKMDFRWTFVDCASGKEITSTNTENVCLKIRATNATFWRAANADGQYSEWSPFKPNVDLETTVVPWTLSCGNGMKEVCVQVQDQDTVAFPICHTIVLAKPPDNYKVELFSDEEMLNPLPECGEYPAATEGKVYVKITAPNKILSLPKFDVIQRGLASVYNQEAEPIQVNEDGSYTVIDPKQVSSEVVDGELTLDGFQTFRGMFTVNREDEIYYKDGLARVVVRSSEICKSRPGAATTTTAPDQETDNIVVPALDRHSPGWSEASGTATWTSQLVSIPVTCADLGLNLAPDASAVPFNLTMGGVAQPFTNSVFAGGTVSFSLRVAKRSLPEWLSAFSSRTLTVRLIKDFLLPTQTTLATTTVSTDDMEAVELDVISGSLDDPASAEDITPITISLTGVPAIIGGTPLAIEVKDESYTSYVNEYGANAKMFVVAVGDSIPSGESPYYVEEF